jgi:Holliday junction resolvase RusA-like endonuclease
LAGKQLLAQRARPVSGPICVKIELACPQRRKFDLDNRIKPLLDLLVTHGLIDADDAGTVKHITVCEGTGFIGARVSISPWEAAP